MRRPSIKEESLIKFCDLADATFEAAVADIEGDKQS